MLDGGQVSASRQPTGIVIALSSQPSVSHSSKAASSRPTITAGMKCLRLMRCEVANERTQVNVEVRVKSDTGQGQVGKAG